MTAGSGFAPANDMSQLLMGLEELSIAMVPQPSRANRPADRRSASMCPNRKNIGCAKNTIMREMSIDAAEAVAISKDRLACRRDAHVIEERKGEDVQKRSRACHDDREDNNAQVSRADDVFARERQRCR